MRKYTKAVIGVLVSLVAIFAIVRKVSLSEVAHDTAGANKSLLIAGVIAVGIGYGIRAFRWWRMLRIKSSSLTLGTTARVLMAGFAANNVLPLRAGDILRVFGFRAALNIPSSFVAATLALERILDLISLLILALFFIRIGAIKAFPNSTVLLLQALTLAGITALVLSLIFTKQIRRCSFWVLDKYIRQSEKRSKIEAAITNMIGLFESIRPLEMVHLTLLSVAAWSFETVLYVCAAKAMHLHVALIWPCMALLAANFSSIVPSSPGYVGTFHASIVAMLLLAAIDHTSATAYAVVVHGVLWSSVTIAGAIAYLNLRARAAQPVHTSSGEIV